MIMRIFLILSLFINSYIVEARMYQWIESETNTTQLSGKPPSWYRSTTNGPRIFVFENGRLIDDTAVTVSDGVRQHMREEAFVLAEEDRQKAKARIAKANEARQKLMKFKPVKEEEEPVLEEVAENSSFIDPTELFEDDRKGEDQARLSDMNLDELRKMIVEWEAQQTESARQALE
jgi:ABC-type methionine transport system ATPase subunit